jgi:putative tryptophan/tyrosine transport system substrate-binding protein
MICSGCAKLSGEEDMGVSIPRRDFVAGLGAASAWSFAASAQQAQRVRRIGILMGAAASDALGQSYLAAFMQEMRQSGWNDGQNLRIDLRWNPGEATLAQIYAAQLIGLMPDLILAGTTINLAAIRQATNTVPVIFTQVADPVTQGFVSNMKQPGGTVTGFSLLEVSLDGKWMDLLKKAAPNLARVALMFNPDDQASRFFVPAVEAAGPLLGVEVMVAPVRSIGEIEGAVANVARFPNSGLMLWGDPLAASQQKLIAELARRHGLPSISGRSNFASDGGLMGYGPSASIEGQFRQAAGYADRILKGTKAGDLPVQSPTRYTLAINAQTAKAIGLEVSPNLSSLADEIIE